MKRCTLALILALYSACAAQETEPSAARDEFLAQVKQWREDDQEQGRLAADREKSISALRADLATPWTWVIMARRYDNACTGTSYHGFCLKRAGESLTVAAWTEIDGVNRTGESRPLTKPEVDRLLSEAALFYLAASLTVTPEEKAGPRPHDPDKEKEKEKEWRQRYLAAGGCPEGIDYVWIEVRVSAPEGVKRHSNMWAQHSPSDFYRWITAFGTLPWQ